MGRSDTSSIRNGCWFHRLRGAAAVSFLEGEYKVTRGAINRTQNSGGHRYMIIIIWHGEIAERQ